MSLRLIIGRAGSGKSTLCLDEIRRELRNQPWGNPIILLVPEQATYQMEVALANTPGLGGSMRAQVLSFRRMGWRVFSQTGGGLKVKIGAMGKRMLLRRILLKHRLDLKAFARSATRPGMADILARVIAEFKLYRITPADLRQVKSMPEVLGDKLSDLALIYEEFQTSLGPDLQDPDDELTDLSGKISSAPLLHEAQIWIDGFVGFTPQELEVVKNLLLTAKEVVITLPLAPNLLSGDTGEGHLQLGEEFFTGPWQTYQELVRAAAETGTAVLPATKLESAQRFRHPWLQHLEACYFAYPTVLYPGDQKPQPGIELISAVNQRAEIEGIAAELRRYARDEGLAWNDMSVMTRELSGYRDLIAQVFAAYEIPFYIDHKHTILHHPLIELVLSTLEVVTSNWGYEPLFRCLKTDFFPLARDEVDRLENYVLEHGIHGERWYNDSFWHYHRQWSLGRNEEQQAREKSLESRLNATKTLICEQIYPLFAGFGDKEKQDDLTVREISAELFVFLDKLGVSSTLRQWAELARTEGKLSEARIHEQIWPAVLQVFDEIVAGLGDELLALEDYSIILASGIEALELGQIPPGPDQVLIGSLDRSRNPEVRIQFLLGANEGVLPARPADDGMLDSEERELLGERGIKLAPQGKELLFEEQFYIYTALTKAREKLVISYPLTDEEGKALGVSPVVQRLKRLFPLTENYLGNQEALAKINHADSALYSYTEQLCSLQQGEGLSPLWQAVEDWLSRDPRRQNRLKQVQSGLSSQNQERKLPRILARQIYGRRLRTSVSRLEQFTRCPFGHYARYGLKLQERPAYQLTRPNMGEFFHTLLHDFAVQLRERGLDWGNLSKQESWALLSELTDQLAPKLQHEILLSSARYTYLTHKLKRTVHHAVRVLGEHARKGIFVPIQLEVKFGPHEALPGVEIPLADGDGLVLSGQIDRVDAAFLDGQIYLRILDYKSREQMLGLDSIYYGLNLQLLTYLHVALQGAEVLLKTETQLTGPTMPAGFLYFPVLEPQLKEKAPLSAEEAERRRLTAIKVSGYLLANPGVLTAMDESFSSGYSELLGIKLTKDGSFRKGSNVLTEEQFSLLQTHLYQTLRQSGEKILSGDISLSPYRRGKSTACLYCEYSPVCHFDPFLPENQYRDLKPIKQDELWQRLQTGDSNVNGSQAANTVSDSNLNWLGGEEHHE